jgi:hypothetical protein
MSNTLPPPRILRTLLVLVTTGWLLTGCHSAHSPSVDIIGSYFPAWIICIVIGLVLTIIVRQCLLGFQIDRHLVRAPLVYLCLMVCFTLVVWLMFFSN